MDVKVEHQLTKPSTATNSTATTCSSTTPVWGTSIPFQSTKTSAKASAPASSSIDWPFLSPPSRLDAYYGNNHLFNPATFASSKSFWTTSLLSAQQLANSKLARQIDSRAYNPDYTFTATMEQFSLGELAAPIIAFGDSEAGTADRALVEYFFGEFFLCEWCWRGNGWTENGWTELTCLDENRKRTSPDFARLEQGECFGHSEGYLDGYWAHSERD
jgi:hypothetical protein